MTVQIELAWLLGTILTINIAVAGFLWRQIQKLDEQLEERATKQETERKDWQKTWTELLERHMEHEEKEFDRLRELQLAFVAIQQKAMSYVTQQDLDTALAPLCEAIEKIERIVDARKARREDPVSGRA
ncbi:MAG: hypothetical protein IPP10_14475 [Candidatus Competibacteraceae bacterium]|jgi:hypothetical protein|nr:hypothetical protein [Candidatus Competibacteraceae bacterium]MBK8963369.1 hypothetical protein [Candidatus Competibacteraceae bacterium]MBK9952676.1 hypothetical protein [Candidatus Competibacteraceae bacterium]